MWKFLDVVEARGEIKDIDLQFALGLGDGQYYAIKTAVKARHPDLVKWHKKTRVCEWIEVIPQKQTTEQDNEKPLEIIEIE